MNYYMEMTTEDKPPLEHDEIARTARRIWEQEGRQAGRDLENWLRAERELLGRRSHASPSRPSPATAVPAPSQGARKPIRLPNSIQTPVHTR
jgi:hypothetical protein